MVATQASGVARKGLVVLLVALSWGCASEAVAPIIEQKQPQPQPQQKLAIYQHVNNPFVAYSLFMDGTFELRYGSWLPYTGTFKRSDSLITFDFGTGQVQSWCSESWCTKWLATASVQGDTLPGLLVVEYDEATTWLLCTDAMDFEICDERRGVYSRSK
jgi:hypothetical protein